jgi:small-conductance mechanosensitive channel
MATLIKDQKEVTFVQGDRVQFSMSNNDDNYSPSRRIVYGTVGNINKVSIVVQGVDGNLYRVLRHELKKYIDPFA